MLETLHSLTKALDTISVHTWENKESLRYWIEDDLIARKIKKYGPKVITKSASQMFSQNYEDDIISEIFSRISPDQRTFLEIGVGNGVECNTRLLMAQGWRGAWVESDHEAVSQIRTRFKAEISSGQLTVYDSFITRDNINALIDASGLGNSVDLLSVDVDMNTHHIWEALTVQPRVACIEYNASFPPTTDFGVPYKENAVWDGSNWFGASLRRMEHIGRGKAMSLVGCDMMGANAFFVSNDCVGDHFLKPFNAETHFEPARYCLLKVRGHRRHE